MLDDPPAEEPWRPVWEDEDATDDRPLWATQAPPQPRPALDWPALALPLAAAEDSLSRLDVGAAAASPPVREGLAARLAFAEAAGWLASAADRAWIHPRDLALAEAGLLGGPGRAGAILAAEADRLPDGATLAQGLALARALRRLASLSGGDPLAAPAGLLQPCCRRMRRRCGCGRSAW